MDEYREIREAIQAADYALNCLNAARDCLQSAGNWGIMDMLGGGILSTFMKHSKMGRAEEALSDARAALRRFAGELRDVEAVANADLRVDDFLSFADYFFDGLIVDWIMQKRIGDAKRQVADAIDRVRSVRARLTALQ